MSRLQRMQSDLQQKMLREREEKMTKLYEENQAKAMEKIRKTNSANGEFGGGNVRRFFNERRENPNINLDSSLTSLDSYLLNASHGRNGINLNRSIGRPIKGSPVGWDKSFPLVPIEKTNGNVSANGKKYSAVSRSQSRRSSLERTKSTALTVNGMRRSKSQILDADSAGPSVQSSPTRGRPVNVRDVKMRNEEKKKLQLEMRKREQELINKIREQQAEIDRMKQEKIREEKAQKARLMRKPIPGSVKPSPSQPPERQITSSAARSTPEIDSENVVPTSSNKSVPTSPTKISPPKKKVVAPPPKIQAKPTPRSGNSDLPECTICGRHFAADRIEKHIQVCSKTTSKKRKVFDPVKMRTQGTEMENYTVKKPGKTKEVKKAPVAKETSRGPQKSNWREKHENFLESIRQAKVVQQHVAAGGKASDLPPPPPMDTSDYVQCPHCGRKFNEAVADRHIPKCQNIKSNKK